MQRAQETARLSVIQSNYAGKVADLSTPQLLLSFIPKNPFADLVGANPTSIISVVIFAAFLGVAALQLLKDVKAKGEHVLIAIDICTHAQFFAHLYGWGPRASLGRTGFVRGLCVFCLKPPPQYYWRFDLLPA